MVHDQSLTAAEIKFAAASDGGISGSLASADLCLFGIS
jgi:hypothetical protein